MKTSLFSAILFSAFTLIGQTALAQTNTETAAIRSWMEAGFNMYLAGDPEGMQHYAEDALFIDWMGKRWNGKEGIREALKADAEMPSTDVRMDILDIRVLAPAVAVVRLEIHGKSVMNGQPFEWTGLDTMILSKASGSWLIEYEQSTPVAPPQGN